MNKTKYVWDFKGDDVWNCGSFHDSIKDCIAEARKENIDEYETVFIGEAVDFVVEVDADQVIEMVEQDAYELAGESAENWDIHLESKESRQELSDALTEVFNEWLKKNRIEAGFYAIENVKTYSLKDGE